MALCRRQCPKCVNAVTVLVDAAEHVRSGGDHVVDIHDTNITDIYNMILEDLGDSRDVAVILRINGVEVAVKCSHLQQINDDCELF